MENLDPIDDDFILFKYDMKFSTVNRKEIDSNGTIRAIKNTLVKQLPWAKELFDYKEEINAYYGPKSRSSGGFRVSLKKNELNKIEERSLEGSDDDEGDTIEETKDGNWNIKEDNTYFQPDEVNQKKDEEDIDSTKSPSRRNMPSSNEEEKITSRNSNSNGQIKSFKNLKSNSKSNYMRGSLNSGSNYDDENELVDQSTLKKLGLLKDEDFLRIHKSLFVNADSKMELEMMYLSLQKKMLSF